MDAKKKSFYGLNIWLKTINSDTFQNIFQTNCCDYCSDSRRFLPDDEKENKCYRK